MPNAYRGLFSMPKKRRVPWSRVGRLADATFKKDSDLSIAACRERAEKPAPSEMLAGTPLAVPFYVGCGVRAVGRSERQHECSLFVHESDVHV